MVRCARGKKYSKPQRLCVTDLPAPRKSGSLRQFGYAVKKSDASRRRALVRAVNSLSVEKRAAARKVIGRLTLVRNLSSNKNPQAARIYKMDSQWLHEKYLGSKK